MFRKRVGVFVTVTLLTVIAGVCEVVQASETGQVVKIGATYPLSGPLAAFGREIKYGIELALDVINNKWPNLDLPVAEWEGIPNLGNAKLEVVLMDDRADPSLGADLTKRLIEDVKVVGMLGCYCSAVTKTASAVAERYGIPFLNAASTSPALTKRGYKWFWRSGPSDEVNMAVLFDFFDALTNGEIKGAGVVPKEEIDDIAMASENTEFGTAAAEMVKKEAAEHGYHIVKSLLYPHAAPNLTSEVQALLAVNPDVIHLNPYVGDAILIVRTLKLFGATPKLLTSNACVTNPDFPKAVGEDAIGIVTMSGYIPKLGQHKPCAAQVDAIFHERTGGHLSGPSARVFTALLVWAEVLNLAGSTEPEAIRAAFQQIEIPERDTIMPWGVKFGDDGQNIYATRMIVQYQPAENSELPELEILYPTSLATAEMIFPFPGFGD